MSDPIFTPFEPALPEASSPEKPADETPKRKRGVRQPARPKAEKPQDPKPVAAEAPAKAKKQRKAKQPRGLKLDLAVVLPAVAGLNEDEARLVVNAANVLQAMSKKSRSHIVAALGKLFA